VNLLGEDASTAAARLRRRAVVSCIVVALWLLFAPSFADRTGPMALSLWFVSNLLAVAVLALSALLWFDAAVLRLIASHADADAGARQADDILHRMALKPERTTPRPLSDRLAGSQRYVMVQQVALILFLLAALGVLNGIGG